MFPGPPPVLLLGRDHEDLCRIGTRALGDAVGLAMSPGAAAKPYWCLDLNEDAAVGAQGRDGWLLAVADGHNGTDAAEAAIRGIASAAPALDDGWSSPQLVAAWAVDAARGAVAEAQPGWPGVRRASRTALTVAVVAQRVAWVATYGDTRAWRVGQRRYRAVGQPSAFLGPRSPCVPVRSVRLRRADLLVLASDGLPDSLDAGLAPALAAARSATSPATAAGGLVAQALFGGARDNVTAVVWSPAREGL